MKRDIHNGGSEPASGLPDGPNGLGAGPAVDSGRPMTVDSFSFFFAVLALCCWAGVVAVGAGALVRRFDGCPRWLEALWSDLGRASLGLAWLVAAVAMFGSLYYSEHAGFVPCKLCWYQRICMYPLVVILAIAAIRRDRGIRVYVIPLAAIGAIISSYHSWIQAFPPEGGTSFCTLEAPCTARYVWEFGFVSIPFMALSGFAFVIAMMLVARGAQTHDQGASGEQPTYP